MRWEHHHIEIEESILTVCCQPAYIEAGIRAVAETRQLIKSYLAQDEVFGRTHVPHESAAGAPELIQRMCRAGQQAGTGPMATVAGAVAESCVRAIVEAGAPEAVADNGGDIVLSIMEPVHIGLYAGEEFPTRLAMHVLPRSGVFSICTSSGTVGHSYSYGLSDSATIISEDVLLADAAATALGNRIQNPDDLIDCFHPLHHLEQVDGALAVCQGRVALWGSLPELVKVDYNRDIITRGLISPAASQ